MSGDPRNPPAEPAPPAGRPDIRAFFDRRPPADYLEEWAARLAQPPEEADRELHSLIVFRLRGEWLALPASALAEVTDPQPIHAIPHRTNHVLLGMVSVRGQIRLAVSLHGLFEIEPDEPADRPSAPRFLILQDGADQWVAGAEEVVGIVRVAQEQLRAVPSTFPRASTHIRAVFDREGRTVGLIEPRTVVRSLRSFCR